MQQTVKTRCENMVLGALVADAAAMGLHWIYDQPHIRKVAGMSPEFRSPDPADYEGVPAYFAHPTRSAGDLSQYGEQTLVMLRALTARDGQYDESTYKAEFRAHFEYGGGYVGYIDHATRETLDNFRRFEDAARRAADSVPFDGAPSVTAALVSIALPLLQTQTGNSLRAAFQDATRQRFNDDAVCDYAARVLDQLLCVTLPSGASDLQLPATAKLPGLVAVETAQGRGKDDIFLRHVASAVRATNDHPTAAAYGGICAQMMHAAAVEGSLDAVLDAALAAADGEPLQLLQDALARRDQDHAEVTAHFGMACDLPFGVPSALHNIASAPSFCDAVRRNIHAGGDSCGRAMIVGAVMGALHGIGGPQGIPPDWIARLSDQAEINSLLSRLVG